MSESLNNNIDTKNSLSETLYKVDKQKVADKIGQKLEQDNFNTIDS